MERERINRLSGEVVDSAMHVHSALGPGLLESASQTCLGHELHSRGFSVEQQVPLPVFYKGAAIELGYRIDLVVEHVLIVEVKAVRSLARIHEAQLLSYLKLSNRRVRLLINFHVAYLKDGVKRLVNHF